MRVRIRGSAVALLAILAVAVSTVPVVADTERGHEGDVGEHSLIDTEDRRGARCFYRDGAGGGEQVLWRISVRPPVVFARFGEQFVGWRAVLQRRLRSGGTWKPFDRSGIQLGVHEKHGPIAFGPITMPVLSNDRYDVRVRVRIIWYGSGDRDVLGRALHEVDWYRHIYRSEEFGDNVVTLRGFCPDFHFGDLGPSRD